MRARFWIPTLLLVAVLAAGQSSNQARYRVILENDSVRVYSLELPPHFHAPSFQNAHDVVWVALNDARVTFVQRDQAPAEVEFRAGDARFFRSFATERVVNEDGTTFRGILVELKSRAASLACGCGSSTEKAVCGCPGATHLPELWAVGLGNITMAGTALAPGEAFRGSGTREDSLLVAITPLELRDEGDAPRALHLKPDEAVWLSAGAHRLHNVGKAKARFVTVEF